ncbi:hypothetical protein GX917_00220 [Candidatus Falkowbacteria bacterium]|jgi:hypothetical protein|nr:hypothetical protein [Candidatus Falkowbacteria bacterium]
MKENQDERKKIMKVGVILIMILVFVFWLFVMKHSFIKQASEVNQDKEELQSIRDELNETLDKLNEGLNKIKEVESENFLPATSSSDILMPDISPVSEEQPIIIPELPEPKDLNSSCPAYINCMPTIGAARSCSIPIGCEGITELVY